MWVARGDQGNEHDNNGLAVEILRLRQERSRLLGFPTYAHWRLADTMAAEPGAAMDLMLQVWKPAVARVREEVADMQRIADAEGAGFRIAPWDYRYYAEKVRKAKYDLDLTALEPYLTIENVRRAMFFAAEKLYGTTMRPLPSAPVFAEGVTAYEVIREGRVIGLWYFDPYAREGKRSGAWSSSFREQSRVPVVSLPIAYDSENFSRGGTISWDDANTMFHEFGHAQHTLYSNVTFPTLAGTNTVRDMVELPSHFNENYQFTAEALRFLVDAEGRPMPAELVEKLKRAMQFNEGFSTVEFLASGIVDMKLHLLPEPPKDMRAFEAATLKEIGMPEEIVMRHRIPHFAHIFTGEGYAAGYYSYLWAQVLVADVFEAFVEAGDPYHRATAQRFFDHVLSVGGSVEAKQAYRNFRGRDAKVDALLRKKGFPCPKELVSW
jgi:peptidyl-dipeptidase Dcp